VINYTIDAIDANHPFLKTRWRKRKHCVASIASILPSMIEALAEDECTLEVFELVVDMACGHWAFSLNSYYRSDLWVDTALVSPDCFRPH